MKADQERVKTLLTDTVTLLCKNGLQFTEELKVQGLLGITLDNNDVFVVHINEIFKGLVGGQVSGIHAEETSAIAAADSATSDLNLKVKKSFPPNYPSPSPVGSAKRKAWTGTSSPAVKVKKEVMDEDLMIIDSKCFDHGDFNTVDDLSGDGDREAMRKSYGEVAQTQQTAPPPKWRVPDSASESFVDSQSQLSGTFSACLMKNESSKTPEGEDTLGDSSLDESRLSGIGQISEGQITYDSAPGCSGWESQVPGPSQVTSGESGSQDSLWRPLVGFARFKSRRPVYGPDKRFRCTYPGCTKSYYERKNLYQHQSLKHGRPVARHGKMRLAAVSVGAAGGDPSRWQDSSLESVDQSFSSTTNSQ